MKSNKLSAHTFFNNAICIMFEVLAVWILFSRMTFFTNKSSDNTFIRIVIFVGLLVSFAVILFLAGKFKAIYHNIKKAIANLSCGKMIFIIVAVGLVTKLSLLFILQIDSQQHGDFAKYWSFIQQLTNSNEITEDIEYAIRFPYTLIYATVFIPFTKIFGVSSILITNIYLVILFTVGSVLLFDTVKYHKGKNYAFVTAMLWICMPLGMIEPLLLVHENALVFFHILAIWLFFRVLPACKNKILKLICLLATAFVISYAAIINQFAYISIIAFIIICFIKLFKSKSRLKAFVSFVLVFVVLACSSVLCNVARNTYVENVVKGELTGAVATHELPFAWVLYVGASYEYAGSWNTEDFNTFIKYREIESVDEAKEYQIKIIKERYIDFLNHPAKLAKHLNNKMEVLNYPFSPINYDAGSKVNDFIMHGLNGHIQDARMAVYSLINVYVGLALVLTFRKRSEYDGHSSLPVYLMLFVIGNFMIMLLVETMPKYSSHLLFVYTTLISLGMNNIKHNINSFNDKIAKIIRH